MTTAYIVPTSTDPSDARYVQRVQVGGVDYLFFFRFNAREGRWFFDLTNADLTPVASGIKVVVGAPLLVNLPASQKPAALMVVVDQASDDPQDQRDPGLTELGARHVLTATEA